jgi:predicted nicotinamide N-methyase
MFDDGATELPRGVAEPQSKKAIVFTFEPFSVTLAPSLAQNMISDVIWRSSLLASTWLSGGDCSERGREGRPVSSHPNHHSNSMVTGKTVLEIGCGSALVGLLAAELGALRVVLTDCDDRALTHLSLSTHHRSVDLRHLLFEQDEADERADKIDREQGVYPTVRHWSDGYRREGDFAELSRADDFDIVIASDCLYFAEQETPLVAVLSRRLSASKGAFALLVVQTRTNGGFQVTRFKDALEGSGLTCTSHDSGPWPWQEMMQESVWATAGQEKVEMAQIKGDKAKQVHLLIVSRGHN